MAHGHKWCDMYCVWCSDIDDVVEEPECDMICDDCEDCSVILDDGRSVKIKESEGDE